LILIDSCAFNTVLRVYQVCFSSVCMSFG